MHGVDSSQVKGSSRNLNSGILGHVKSGRSLLHELRHGVKAWALCEEFDGDSRDCWDTSYHPTILLFVILMLAPQLFIQYNTYTRVAST